MLEEEVKIYRIGTDEVILYTTYIEVRIACTKTSVLDWFTYSYEESKGLHPIDLINDAWYRHNKEYNIYMESLWEE